MRIRFTIAISIPLARSVGAANLTGSALAVAWDATPKGAADHALRTLVILLLASSICLLSHAIGTGLGLALPQ
ncbi:hypothetical protein LRM36_01035 [Stenotrophomonas maltophilia]|nr:hypothetical protein [Stenotrophomonas maltophilia]